MELLIAIIAWISLAIVVGKFWQIRGHKYEKGIVLSIILSPLVGFLIGAALQPNQKEKERMKIESGLMKKCPSCAELVKSEAKKCRYCRHEFIELRTSNENINITNKTESRETKELRQNSIKMVEKGICPFCENPISSKNTTTCFSCGIDLPS